MSLVFGITQHTSYFWLSPKVTKNPRLRFTAGSLHQLCTLSKDLLTGFATSKACFVRHAFDNQVRHIAGYYSLGKADAYKRIPSEAKVRLDAPGVSVVFRQLGTFSAYNLSSTCLSNV